MQDIADGTCTFLDWNFIQAYLDLNPVTRTMESLSRIGLAIAQTTGNKDAEKEWFFPSDAHVPQKTTQELYQQSANVNLDVLDWL